MRMRTGARRLVAATALLLCIADPVAAADRFVSNDCLSSSNPCDTITHALTQATSGDVVKATFGQYVEGLLIDSSITLTLSGGWSLDFASRDPLTSPSILQGIGDSVPELLRVVTGVGDTIDLTVDGFALNHARTGLIAVADGGALTLTLQSCTLKQNHYSAFAAYAQQTGTLTLAISDSVFSTNRSGEEGAITLWSSDTAQLDATLNGVSLERNFHFRFDSGGTYALAARAQDTSALSVVGTDVSVTKTRGPGIQVVNTGTATCDMTLTNADVRKNRGTGIRVQGAGSSLTLANGILAGNRTRAIQGGSAGIVLSGGSLTIVNSTIRGNRSSCCAGGLGLSSGSADVSNAIVWDNHTLNAFADDIEINTASVAVDHSDLGAVGGSFSDGGGNISADPLFVSRRDDHLTALSPAVNTGTCTGAPAADFEGDPRPSGGGCDMGADEFVP
jgi:hypothetical protein